MSYQKLAKDILDGVGGKENVNAVWHCATRLRFKLNDASAANTKKIENTDGVITVVNSAGQYQVVVGNSVSQVYDELTSLPGMAVHVSANTESASEKRTGKFNPVSKLMDFVSVPYSLLSWELWLEPEF